MADTNTAASNDYDIEFFWDPVCPFAWITSRWVAKVAEQSDYKIDWRFISLKILNKGKDYATEFPPEYEFLHTAGLRMLRVASAVRADLGRDPLGPLVAAYGESFWDQPEGSRATSSLSTHDHVVGVLAAAGLSEDYAAALEDESWDEQLEAETELALSRTGRDVGTPIITFDPPDGLSFFGPVLSRIPSDEEAVPLWDAVISLASFPGFAEMKRSMREMPQLEVLGSVGAAPKQEDWTGGRRVGHLASERAQASEAAASAGEDQ